MSPAGLSAARERLMDSTETTAADAAPPQELPATRRGVRHRHFAPLSQYFLLTYLVMLVNASQFLGNVVYADALTAVFALVVLLVYAAIYLLPVHGPVLLLDWLLGFIRPWRRLWAAIVYAVAVLGFALLQIVIFADAFIFRLWIRHVGSYDWNLLTTPGGIASMGNSESTVVSFSLIIAGFLILQAGLLVVVLKVRWIGRTLRRTFTPKVAVAAAAAAVFLAAAQAVTYGVCSLRAHTPVLHAATRFPFFQPLTFSKLGRRLGWEVPRDEFALHAGGRYLDYPRHPLRRVENPRRYNLVFLVAESLRADSLDPEIMPATWKFAQENQWFTRHFAGGNCTRMGLFTFFYGLYGTYWFPMLESRRSPVLMDLIQKDNYQIELFTSQAFTYPEFDKTVFVHVPGRNMHAYSDGAPTWQRDRVNVGQIVDFIDRRDPSRPFMLFMFYESAHAHYYFPPANIIRRPYTENLNYATMDLKRDAPVLIKNRYLNACNHLDGQFMRVIDRLRRRGLLDSTIVVITGDHGEEFMEKGHWGHASNLFHDGQQLVPMILHAPALPAKRHDHTTSHVDVAATVLTLLGVTNPPEDYSLGYDMLGPGRRAYTVMNSWDMIAYRDETAKIVMPYRGNALAGTVVMTSDDRVLDGRERSEALRRRLAVLNRVQADIRKFLK